MAPYERDWTGRYGAPALAVVRPRTAAEVAIVLRTCADANLPVVPQGGNTGLVGGSVPRAGSERQVLLSLARLSGVIRVDPEESVLEALSGTPLAVAQAAASQVDCELGIDLASRDSATLGGMVATNAGGVHVVAFGAMRARTAGLESVLTDGTVISRMSGLVKDNTGYDLCGLLAGSEGTLAVITSVLVRLVARPRHKVVALVALGASVRAEDLPHPGAAPTEGELAAVGQVTSEAVRLTGALRRGAVQLRAVELVFAQGMRLVLDHTAMAAPPDPGAGAWLLVEVAGASDPTEALAGVVESDPGVTAAAVASNAAEQARLWAYRERHTESIAALGMAHKLDVTLPKMRLAGFASNVLRTVADIDPGWTVVLFGHVADGNVHVNIVGPGPTDQRADDAVLDLVLAMDGSISAEHGIGIAKRAMVSRARPGADLLAMRRIKTAFDPRGLLNPGVLVDPV